MKKARFAELDGLRGVAILLVISYHYFTRWAPEGLYPYGSMFSVIGVRDGSVGVLLFFIISGFVIMNSLQRIGSFRDFVIKRADRLVLPMVVLSTLAFILLSGPLATPHLEQNVANLLPSWTFTTPKFWTWVNPQIDYVDGAYWTLFVEVRFYLLISIVWFCLPKSVNDIIFTAIAALSVGLYAVAKVTASDTVVRLLDLFLFPPYISLFASGIIYFNLMKTGWDRRSAAQLILLIPISTYALTFKIDDPSNYGPTIISALAFHAIFICICTGLTWTRIFGFWPLVFVGRISYSLYLIHQNVGVALIHRLDSGMAPVTYLLAVAGIVGLMIALAYLSWRYIEEQKPISSLTRVGRARFS